MLKHFFSIATLFEFLNLIVWIIGGSYYALRSLRGPLRTAIDQEETQKHAWLNSISGLKIQKNNLLLALNQEKQLTQQLLIKVHQWQKLAEQKKTEAYEQQNYLRQKQQNRVQQQQLALEQENLLKQAIPQALKKIELHQQQYFSESQTQKEYLERILTLLSQQDV